MQVFVSKSTFFGGKRINCLEINAKIVNFAKLFKLAENIVIRW